jgi:hypothetical protein
MQNLFAHNAGVSQYGPNLHWNGNYGNGNLITMPSSPSKESHEEAR